LNLVVGNFRYFCKDFQDYDLLARRR